MAAALCRVLLQPATAVPVFGALLPPLQVAVHEWVTDGGKLPPVPLSRSSNVAVGSTGQQHQQQQKVGGSGGGGSCGAVPTLTAWVRQMKQAVPAVEERSYKRGQVLIRCGTQPQLPPSDVCRQHLPGC